MRDPKSLLILGLCLLAPLVTGAQDTATLKAVMIYASDKPAPIDLRLENIEYKLRRIFKFEHYLHYGEGTLTLTLPGSGTIKLGKGYELDVQASRISGGRIRAEVTWRKGNVKLLHTAQAVGRKTPAVLGGAGHDDGTLIVTLVLE